MFDIKDEIWQKQIGFDNDYGFDFSGREIHYIDFKNYNSKYGWSIIPLDDEEYLIVHIDTEEEFPEDIPSKDMDEFVINGKTYNITRNNFGEWDINLIEYEEEYIQNEHNDDEEEDVPKIKIRNTSSRKNKKTTKNKKTSNNDLLIEKHLQEIEKIKNELNSQKEMTQRFEPQNNNKNLYKEMDSFFSPLEQHGSSSIINKDIINSLNKKLEEQSALIQSLKNEQQYNLEKLNSMERENENSKPNSKTIKMWESTFGKDTFGVDFAGRVMSKDKFKKDEEGGWDIDFYSEDESYETFIASTKTIKERAGRMTFNIDNFTYHIYKNSDNWEINKGKKGQNFELSSKNLKNIAAKYKPDRKVFEGRYETYSSLLINLYHFPLIYLDTFEEFIEESLSKLSFFKESFIYSNERLYKKNESNISSYARVFFKSHSTDDDIKIILTAMSFKKAMIAFISNFKITNKRDPISFTLILMNHQKLLKFVHAQTNFELLRAHPIPLRIPLEHLIIDKEFNKILKFHENNLWRQLKPYAMDWHNNVYYVCDIDADSIDTSFSSEFDED